MKFLCCILFAIDMLIKLQFRVNNHPNIFYFIYNSHIKFVTIFSHEICNASSFLTNIDAVTYYCGECLVAEH